MLDPPFDARRAAHIRGLPEGAERLDRVRTGILRSDSFTRLVLGNASPYVGGDARV